MLFCRRCSGWQWRGSITSITSRSPTSRVSSVCWEPRWYAHSSFLQWCGHLDWPNRYGSGASWSIYKHFVLNLCMCCTRSLKKESKKSAEKQQQPRVFFEQSDYGRGYIMLEEKTYEFRKQVVWQCSTSRNSFGNPWNKLLHNANSQRKSPEAT